MSNIGYSDFQVLNYIKKYDSCFLDEIVDKFDQTGIANIDTLTDLGYIFMPCASDLSKALEGKPTSSKMISNCIMLTPAGEKAIKDYKTQLKLQHREITLRILPIIISLISLVVSICVAIYK